MALILSRYDQKSLVIKNGEAVMMCMDTHPERNEVSTTYAQRLMTSK